MLPLLKITTMVFFAVTNHHSESLAGYQRAHQIVMEEVTSHSQGLLENKTKKLLTHFDKEEQNLESDLNRLRRSLEVSLLRFLRKSQSPKHRPMALYQIGTLYFQFGQNDKKYFQDAERYFDMLLNEYPRFSYREVVHPRSFVESLEIERAFRFVQDSLIIRKSFLVLEFMEKVFGNTKTRFVNKPTGWEFSQQTTKSGYGLCFPTIL